MVLLYSFDRFDGALFNLHTAQGYKSICEQSFSVQSGRESDFNVHQKGVFITTKDAIIETQNPPLSKVIPTRLGDLQEQGLAVKCT